MKTCLVSILRWLCIISTSNKMLNQSNNNNDIFDPTSWRQSRLKFKNSSNVASFERNSTQTGLLTLCPPLKRMEIWICIDFCDLNIVYPKDEFSLPITDIMIDNTCGFKKISFMDGFSWYNQIKMYLNDEKHTSFWTPLGVFCYTIMLFGLKNVGATYQRAWSTIFCDHLRKTVDCYIDNIRIKSHDKNNHLHDLWKMFDLMRAYQLKMNPSKFFLGVSSDKFLGFIITSKGIHLDPDKIKAIQDMRPLENLKELRGLQGRLATSVDSS